MPLLSAYYEPSIWLGAINTEKNKQTLHTFALTHIKETNSQNPKLREMRNKKRSNNPKQQQQVTISYQYKHKLLKPE